MSLHILQRYCIYLGNWINGYNRSTQNNNELSWIVFFFPVKTQVGTSEAYAGSTPSGAQAASTIFSLHHRLMAFVMTA